MVSDLSLLVIESGESRLFDSVCFGLGVRAPFLESNSKPMLVTYSLAKLKACRVDDVI